MRGDRDARAPEVLVRIGHPQLVRLVERHPVRHISRQRVVRGGLVGDEIEVLPAPCELGDDVGGVAEQPDRERATSTSRLAHAGERVVERLGRLVEIPRLEPALDPGRVDLDAQDGSARERRRERLRTAHAAEPGGQHRPAGERRRAEVLLPGGGKRLVRALQDPLRADVDP